MNSSTPLSLPSWVNTISDSTIRNDISAAIEAGPITFASMQQLFQDVAAEIGKSGTLGASRFQDLQTVVANLATVGASDYVQYVSAALVDGNANNVSYTGGQATSVAMGNLTVNSSYTQLNDLIGDWFLGNNDPSTSVSWAASEAGTISYVTTTLPLYSNGGPSINDVNQGDLGDCYLVCSLGEVALQDPTAIENMIHDNGNGTYGVRFFINGQAQWVTVDSTLASSNGSQPFNDAYVSAQNMWVNLIEKAYAEISTATDVNDNTDGWAGNSYSSVGDGGWPEISLAQITGATKLNFLFSNSADNDWGVGTALATAPQTVSESTLADTDLQAFNAIVAAFTAHDDVVFASYTDTYDSSGRGELMASHAFSVIGYDAANQTIELRNPWGVAPSFQYWDTTFYISLSSLAGTNDYFSFDNGAPATLAPTVEANSIDVTSSTSAFASAAGISAVDPNGVSLANLVFTISYTGTAGVLKLNNVAEPTSTSFTVTGAELSELSYILNAGAGTDTFAISVSDGIASSATLSFSVTTTARKPTVKANSITLTTNATVSNFATAAGISAVDPNGVSLANLVYTISYSGGAGTLDLNGVIEAAGSSFTITGADLSELSYVPTNGGVETVTISANDGYATSAPVTFTVTSPVLPKITPPTITVDATPTLSPGQSLSLTSIFSVVDNNGIAASNLTYTLWEVWGQGNIVIGNTVEPTDTTFTLTAAQFAQAKYVANGGGGTDVVELTVSDGISSSWGATFLTVLGLEVTPHSVTTTLRGQTYTASQLFTATDTAGVAITSYTIDDQNGFPGEGHFFLNGVEEADNASFTVSASQLSNLIYISPLAGTDFIKVSATAGSYTSSQATVFFSAPFPTVPTVTVKSAILSSAGSKSILLSSLISASATNDLPTSDYTYYIDDKGSSGYFSVGGIDQGDFVFLTAAQFAETSYISTVKSGSDTITVEFTDGYFLSNTETLTITTIPSASPIITANSTTLTNWQPVLASSLFSATNPNGVAAAELSYTLSYSGAAGALELNGIAETAGSSFTVTGAELSELTYVPSVYGGSDAVTVSVDDGFATSATVSFTITSPISAGPVFTATNTAIAPLRNQIYTTTSAVKPFGLYSATDAAGAAIVQYEFDVNDAAGGLGSLLLNGVAQVNDAVLTVSASALNTVSYQAIAGSEVLAIRANDGTAANPHWGAWSIITVAAPASTTGAVFTAANATITPTRGQIYATTSASNPFGLYTETDPSGGVIAQYEFDVNDTAGGLGNLFVGGVAAANDTVLVVGASALNTVSYQAIAGSEVLAIRANDGTVAHPIWGAWSVITVTAPTATSGANFTTANAAISAASGNVYSTTTASSPLGLFSAAADTTGGAIAQYEFFDSASAGSVGGFLVSGATETNGAVLAVSASALSTVTYSISSGSQAISIRANDGTLVHPVWGAWTTVTVTVGAVATATNATITPTRDQTYTTTTSSNPLGLYSVSDETGNAITQYEFDVNDTAGGLGNLLVSGVAQANDAVLVVNASALNTVSYQAIAGSEVLAIRANDGTASNPHWGAWSLITVNAPAKTAAATFTAIYTDIGVGAGSVFSTTSASSPLGLYNAVTDPSGGPIVQYDFFDSSTTSSSGNLRLNGVAQANGTHVVVNASALNTVTYLLSSGTQTIGIRANDGTIAHPIWGAWTTATVATESIIPASPIANLLSNFSSVPVTATASVVSTVALLHPASQLTPLFATHSA